MHIPVLLSEVLHYLAPKRGDSYLDLTAGYGGHASKILEVSKNFEDSVLVDRDSQAVDHLKKLFAGQEVQIIKSDFVRAAEQMAEDGKKFDMIFADLGISSVHLDNAERGFSFQSDSPLDMRMDQSQQLSAEQVVNKYAEKDLARILRDYGEEYKAAKIARAIVQNRPIQSTKQLAELVVSTKKQGRAKVHPATKTFQAIRIEVNQELAQLEKVLPILEDLLSSEGRLAIISFHSLEDRIVKQFFADRTEMLADEQGREIRLRKLTKKPITATKDEIVNNPRARSAKLRAVAKIKTERSN